MWSEFNFLYASLNSGEVMLVYYTEFMLYSHLVEDEDECASEVRLRSYYQSYCFVPK